MSKRKRTSAPKPVAEVSVGEKTGLQQKSNTFGMSGGVGASVGMPGFFPAPAGTYHTYRQISSHPTVALVMSIVKSPIISNEWIWSKRDKAVPDLWVKFIEKILAPKRHQIVTDMLRALEFGWAPFEKVYNAGQVDLGDDGMMDAITLDQLKPLLWESTELWLDNQSGHITGVVNTSPEKGEVKLPMNKCLYHLNEAIPGLPYGRSRHENIRQVWAEAEQLRQRIAQYMKKVAGIVVQLHYPEGTSKTAQGADWPNQWHGQQILDHVAAGHSVMMPNGYASIDPRIDPKGAYDLAGKSQWVLSTVNTGGTDYAPGMREVLEYYDQSLFQGWLRPARSGLEARYGSRADAEKHSSTGILDCESVDLAIAHTVNTQLIDDLLVMQFGPQAKGTVFVNPTPIADDSLTSKENILKAIISSQFGAQAIAQIDLRSLSDDLDIKLNDVSETEHVEGQTGNVKPTVTSERALQMLMDAGYSREEAIAKSSGSSSRKLGLAGGGGIVLDKHPRNKQGKFASTDTRAK